MRKKKFLGFIETDPFILFHYIPLIGVFILSSILLVKSGLADLENPTLRWIVYIIWNYLFLLVGDQLIHKIGGEY